MKTTRPIICRVDAGPGIGLGHLQRCLSIAIGLRDLGVECVFLSPNDDEVRKKITRLGFVTNPLPKAKLGGPKDLSSLLATARIYGSQSVLVDSYFTDDFFYAQLLDAGLYVAAIDDLGRSFKCNLLIDSSVDAGTIRSRRVTKGVKFLLGPDYAPLNQEFWDLPKRIINKNIEDILITMGGADSFGLTPSIIESLDSIDADFAVRVIVGPLFKNATEIHDVASKAAHVFNTVDNPTAMKNFMLEADIAISAGGQTLYELSATGVPTIAVKIADNQSGNLKSFFEAGTIFPITFRSIQQMHRKIYSAMNGKFADYDVRSAMSSSGQSLVDGKGAIRCARELASLISWHE